VSAVRIVTIEIRLGEWRKQNLATYTADWLGEERGLPGEGNNTRYNSRIPY